MGECVCETQGLPPTLSPSLIISGPLHMLLLIADKGVCVCVCVCVCGVCVCVCVYSQLCLSIMFTVNTCCPLTHILIPLKPVSSSGGDVYIYLPPLSLSLSLSLSLFSPHSVHTHE